jgi:hypothetical protein
MVVAASTNAAASAELVPNFWTRPIQDGNSLSYIDFSQVPAIAADDVRANLLRSSTDETDPDAPLEKS